MYILATSSGKARIRLQICEDFIVAFFGRSTCMPFFVGFIVMTGMALWIHGSTVSSSKNVPIVAVSATNGLRFYCSTLIQILYWDRQ